MAAFVALLAVVLVWGLVSARLGRYSVTLPIVLVVVGLSSPPPTCWWSSSTPSRSEYSLS